MKNQDKIKGSGSQKIVKNASDLKRKEMVEIQFAKGRALAEVNEIFDK